MILLIIILALIVVFIVIRKSSKKAAKPTKPAMRPITAIDIIGCTIYCPKK